MSKKLFVFSLIFFLASAGIMFFADLKPASAAVASAMCSCSGCVAPPEDFSVRVELPGDPTGAALEAALNAECTRYCQFSDATCDGTIDEVTAVSGDEATPYVAGVCCISGAVNAAATTETACRTASGTWMAGVTSCSGAPTTGGSTKSEGVKAIDLPNPLGTTDIRVVIGRIIKAVMGIIGSIALVLFMWGGFMWMTAAGDSGKVKKGQQTIIAATIGLAIIFLSYTIVNFVLSSLTSLGEETEQTE
jgi:hypothetical protein